MWLPLVEYSNRYQISISTLRRRIRSESVKYRLEDGKYFVFDGSESEFLELEKSSVGEHLNKSLEEAQPSTKSVLMTTHHLVEELKKAYTMILQEKEEQICQLREEISDLRTLVRVLESENERLK